MQRYSLNQMGACFGKKQWCAHIDYNYGGSQGVDYGRYPSVMGCGNFANENQRYCSSHDAQSRHRQTLHETEYYLYLKEKYAHRIRCSCIQDERS